MMKKYLSIFCLLVLASSSYAANTPCSRGKGGIAYCDGDRFVCNDGSYSASQKICSASLYGTGNKKKQSPNKAISTQTKTSKLETSAVQNDKKTPKEINITETNLYGRTLTKNDLLLEPVITKLNDYLLKMKFTDSELVDLPYSIINQHNTKKFEDFYNLSFHTLVFGNSNFHIDMFKEKITLLRFEVRDELDRDNLRNSFLVCKALLQTFLPDISDKDLITVIKKVGANKAKTHYKINNIIITHEYTVDEHDYYSEMISFDTSSIVKKGFYFSSFNEEYYDKSEIDRLQSELDARLAKIVKNESDIESYKRELNQTKNELNNDDIAQTTVGILTLGLSSVAGYKDSDVKKGMKEIDDLNEAILIRKKEIDIHQTKINKLREILNSVKLIQ